MLRNLTNYNRNSKQEKNSKYKKISNYQISHVFGKTVIPINERILKKYDCIMKEAEEIIKL